MNQINHFHLPLPRDKHGLDANALQKASLPLSNTKAAQHSTIQFGNAGKQMTQAFLAAVNNLTNHLVNQLEAPTHYLKHLFDRYVFTHFLQMESMLAISTPDQCTHYPCIAPNFIHHRPHQPNAVLHNNDEKTATDNPTKQNCTQPLAENISDQDAKQANNDKKDNTPLTPESDIQGLQDLVGDLEIEGETDFSDLSTWVMNVNNGMIPKKNLDPD